METIGLLAQELADLKDSCVVVSVEQRAGPPVGMLQIGFRRAARHPEILIRPAREVRPGIWRLSIWLPRGAKDVLLLDEKGQALRPKNFRLAICKLPLSELLLRIAMRRPDKMLAIIRLLLHRNMRGVSFRIGRLTDELNAPSYRQWASERLLPTAAEPPDPPCRPMIYVTLCATNPRSIAKLYRCLRQQSYKNYTIVSLAEMNRVLDEATKPLWIRLNGDALLAPDAFAAMVEPFQDERVSAVYADEDRPSWFRGRRPFFQPAWDPLLARSGWLSLEGSMLRLSGRLRPVDFERMPIAEMISAIDPEGRNLVVHIPRILVHRKTQPPTPDIAKPPIIAARTPAVSVIIPTRDRVDLLRACIRGLETRTRGVELDVVIVDNDSREPAALDYLAALETTGRARVIRMPGRFNFSKACNLGVAAARHDRILLLNNDVTPINAEWLAQMCGELDGPQVGAVGALLLFPDGFVQHAGVVLGAGAIARHAFHFTSVRSRASRGLINQRRLVSAVTAACLLTKKDLWDRVGGMDEAAFAVAFNDVDYCLKLRHRGEHIVWTPFARLWHQESVSRGKDDTPEKLRRFAEEERIMQERWADRLENDPFYNPSLSLIAEEDVLASIPRDRSPRANSGELVGPRCDQGLARP